MKNNTKLTDSEWKIIDVLWEGSPRTLRQIIDSVYERTGWSKHTVISFLKRMEQKGSIIAQESKPAKLYYAAIDKQSVVNNETDYMLKKLYGGNSALLVSNMAEKLSSDDIEEMITILQNAKGDNEDE